MTKKAFNKWIFNLIEIEKDSSNYKVRVLEERVTSNILKEYRDFKYLFIEVVNSNTLLKY